MTEFRTCSELGAVLLLIATHPGDRFLAHLGLFHSGQSPRPTRAQRRRSLIWSVRRAADAVVPAQRHEAPSAVVRPVRLPLDGGAAPG